jgi:hypothetical protein
MTAHYVWVAAGAAVVLAAFGVVAAVLHGLETLDAEIR